MTLTDALLHPWLSLTPYPAPNATPAAAPPTTPQPKSQPPPPPSNPAALDRNLSDLSELSELPEDAENDAAAADEDNNVHRDVSMLSAAPSADDMPGVQALNIGSPARARVRAPLERRSQVLARELAAEADDVAASPTAANPNGSGGGKRTRDAAGSPDADVAMGDNSGLDDSDGMGAAQVPRAAKRGRRNADGQDGVALPPPQGRALRSRNPGAPAPATGAAPR